MQQSTMQPNEIRLTDEAFSINAKGPILLLAGPGTGKTYQLAKRIQYLTDEQKVIPEQITVITFTKEAARSMTAKISEKGKAEFVDAAKRPKTIRTMHSLGHTIISGDPATVGLSEGFQVLESDDMRKVLFLDAAFNLGFSPEHAKKALTHRGVASRGTDQESEQIIKRYEEILRASNYIDYDDQIRLAVQLLRAKADALEKYSESAKYLLIDEYQDINADQFDMIRLLSSKNPAGLFVVGDDDQSIYKFRGGSPEFIRNFKDHFGVQSEVVQMKTSRRCPKQILECANHLVALHDGGRLPKHSPEYNMPHAGEVIIHNCPSEAREAEIIATIIKEEAQNTVDKRTAFILVPTRNYVPTIQTALSKFRINGDVPRDEADSLHKFVFVQKWAENPQSNLFARYVLQQIIDGGSTVIPGPRSRTVKRDERHTHLKAVAEIWNPVLAKHDSFWDVLQTEAKNNKLFNDLVTKMNDISASYHKDLGEFLRNMVRYAKAWSSRDNFFAELLLMSGNSANQPLIGNYQVRILSMQKSKGLEANTVFVVGLEEGSVPAGNTTQEVAEAARLIFVAMTRAKETLHLMHARKREGASTFKTNSHGLKASPFVTCLPKHNIKTQFHPAQDQIKSKDTLAKAKGMN